MTRCQCQFLPPHRQPVALCPMGQLLANAVTASQDGFSAAIVAECQRAYDAHVDAARGAALGEGVRDVA